MGTSFSNSPFPFHRHFFFPKILLVTILCGFWVSLLLMMTLMFFLRWGKYSFGAVVEEFELHDAMAQILAEKDDRAGNNPGGTNNEFEYGVPQLAFGMAQQQISAH
jgi:hypothetical protein